MKKQNLYSRTDTSQGAEDFLKGISFMEFNPNKFLVHFDKLKTLSEGGDVYPVTVEIDPVSFCNHKCDWCVDPKHMNFSLDKKFVFELLKELRALNVKGIVFKGGGEPTLHPDFAQLAHKARNLGFEVGLVTNGSRVGELAESINQNCNYVRISIDGPNQSAHKRIHKANDFTKIIFGVKKLVLVRKKTKQRHPIIGLSFAMDYSSKDLVAKAIELGDGIGVDYVLFRTPFYEEVGRNPTMTVQESFELKNIFHDEAKKYAGKMRIFVDYWVSDSEAKELGTSLKGSPRRGVIMKKDANGVEHVTKKCLASPLLCVVSANKKVYPCCNLRFLDDWSVGEINYEEGNTFESVWNSQKRKDVLKEIECVNCIRYCTHPLSKYNEIIAYLQSEKHHSSFV
jgi:MoaA/NifB/PqqE/SkfB family radical SAM enzyme